MKTFKEIRNLVEGKVSMAKLKAGLKLNIIAVGRQARTAGLSKANIYDGKVKILGVGIIPFKAQPKKSMVIAKDIKDLKKKYEKVFKDEDYMYGSYFNSRHKLNTAFNIISKGKGFGGWIFEVAEGENKGKMGYCYIGTGRNDEWEVRVNNFGVEFQFET